MKYINPLVVETPHCHLLRSGIAFLLRSKIKTELLPK